MPAAGFYILGLGYTVLAAADVLTLGGASGLLKFGIKTVTKLPSLLKSGWGWVVLRTAGKEAGKDIAEALGTKALPVVNMGKQGKHILGHNNYKPGRSILKADPIVLARRAGTGMPVNKIPPGQAGFKERIGFKDVIGDFVKNGVATPTKNGIITYAKDGSIHIIPAAP